MSDAMTDIYRDQRRHEYKTHFLFMVVKYLVECQKEPGIFCHPENKSVLMEELIAAANDCDSIGRGYFEGKTNLAAGIEVWVDGLVAVEYKSWLKLIIRCSDVTSYDGFSVWGMSLSDKVKELSPFRDCFLMIGDERSPMEWPMFMYKTLEQYGFSRENAREAVFVLEKPKIIKVINRTTGEVIKPLKK